MNVGPNRNAAIAWARANAKADNSPRYLHRYAGVYWLERHPPTPGPMAGSAGSDHLVVFPGGAYREYDPVKGPPDQ